MQRKLYDLPEGCFEMIPLDKNYGFAVAANAGIKQVKTKYVTLLNNDTEVTPGWLEAMLYELAQRPRLGLVGATTDNISSCQQVEKAKSRAGGENYFDVPSGNVAYFCVTLRMAAIEEVGYLDPEFFNGGEDDDMNDRLRAAGWGTGVTMLSFVYHVHLATRGKLPEFQEHSRRNCERLAAKREARREKNER